MSAFIGKLCKLFSGAMNLHIQSTTIIAAASLMALSLYACQPSTAATTGSSEATPPLPSITLAYTQNPGPTPSTASTANPPDLPSDPSTTTPTPTTEPAGSRQVTLMAVGDIMLGRTIGDLIENEGPEAPFFDTAPTLSSADITVGNLECPISNRGTPEEKTYAFRAPPAAGTSLALAGFDVVSLANNHALDYGPLALEDTLAILAENQISPVGAGMDAEQAYRPIILEINGLRIAFLAYMDIPATDYNYLAWEAAQNKAGIAWAHPERVQQGVSAASEIADVVVVLVHNGYEIVQRVSGDQQKIAKLAIDSGASLVIGHHPHVLQRIETYNDGLIAYSMGNFVFDNFLFPPNYSAILKVELSENGVESYELIDVIVQLNGVPQIMPYDLED
jgi:poly-gamma-glutamate capsule biosynthesis protein CapA/YwtB (metallophosphatase superfamily)